MRWTITEKDNGRNFLFTKPVIDFFLIDKRYIFMHTAKIGLWQIFQLSIFVLSREKCHYPGQVRYFRFYFCISFTSASRKFWATLSVWNTNCLLEPSDKRPWIENGQRFAIHFQTWNSWLMISNLFKKKLLQHCTRTVTVFIRARNPSKTPQFIQ